MDIENPFYQQIIGALNNNKVEFILIGGLAVGYHGYSRYTGDMDLWLNPTIANLERLYITLEALGYDQELIHKIKEKRNVEHPTPIKLWDDSSTFKVDLKTYTFQEEISWQESRNLSTIINIGDFTFPVVHINHLIYMKKNSARLENSLKDLADASELEKIKNKQQPES